MDQPQTTTPCPAPPDQVGTTADALKAKYLRLAAACEREERVIGPFVASAMTKAGYAQAEQAVRVEASEDRQRKAERIERSRRLRAQCGTWKRYAAADLDDVSRLREACADVLPAYLAVRDRLADLITKPDTVFLRGANGPGKTHLASAVVHRFCDCGRGARYVRAMDFFTELKSTYGVEGRTEKDVLSLFQGYEMLVIDEYDVRSDSNWENMQVRSLLDARYMNLVATIVITNLSFEDLQEKLCRALRDRIRESGSVIDCDWGSVRKFLRPS